MPRKDRTDRTRRRSGRTGRIYKPDRTGMPRLGAQRPAQKGRTEACPEWAHRGLTIEWVHKKPVPNGRAEASQNGRPKAYPNWAHGDLPRMGASRPARNERTEAAQTGRTEACPECVHSDLPRKGAQRPAQNGRTTACPGWARRGRPGMTRRELPERAHRGLPGTGARPGARRRTGSRAIANAVSCVLAHTFPHGVLPLVSRGEKPARSSSWFAV